MQSAFHGLATHCFRDCGSVKKKKSFIKFVCFSKTILGTGQVQLGLSKSKAYLMSVKLMQLLFCSRLLESFLVITFSQNRCSIVLSCCKGEKTAACSSSIIPSYFIFNLLSKLQVKTFDVCAKLIHFSVLAGLERISRSYACG